MRVVGIVAEYNPFHNGHLYHIEQSKKITGADYCVVIMSGSFVQRGAPAIYDKYVRTLAALRAGADLVLEMPAPFSTASAREFATYAMSLLTNLGCIDSVCFGSEAGNVTSLQSLASIFSRETSEYSSLLRNGLKEGLSFPKAREAAAYSCLLSSEKKELTQLLGQPNNILGIEYISALHRLHSPVVPFTIKRSDKGYHHDSATSPLCSAFAIRKALSEGSPVAGISHAIPKQIDTLYQAETPVFPADFSLLLNCEILRCLELGRPLDCFEDVSGEMASRLLRGAQSYTSFEDKIQELKTKQVTYTRISRGLVHLLLNIQKEEMVIMREAGYATYARILGFQKSASPLLRRIKQNTGIPLVNKMADSGRSLGEESRLLLSKEVFASRLYQAVQAGKGRRVTDEYKRSVIIL